MTADTDEAARRAARRAFIRAHHPDLGGDARAFAEGLAGFATTPAPARPPVTVVRSRSVGRLLVRSVRDVRRRLAGHPRRRLL